jgi:hypothetical protein
MSNRIVLGVIGDIALTSGVAALVFSLGSAIDP